MIEGKYYVVFVPPGWLLAVHVAKVEEHTVTIADAAYLELSGDSSSPLAELPRATKPAEMAKICTRSWPLQDGMILRREGLLIAVPCVGDLSSLTRAHVAGTIRGAK
jgi:hypothetical protein